MTPEQKIIAIAEFEGWSNCQLIYGEPMGRPPNASDQLKLLPPYLTSRDAICGAVARLDDMEFCHFVEHLERVCKTDGWEIMGPTDRRRMILATPSQLADALLLTLGHKL